MLERDGGACLHCGTTSGLVPQHRMNRGMGGSIFLEMPANTITFCSRFNGEIEDNSEAASLALAMGWKLGRFYSESPMTRILETPVFDRNTGLWYTLDNEWKRALREHPQNPTLV